MAANPMIGDKPIITKKTLFDLLGRLSVSKGDTVIVHSSLKSLGYVVGGSEAVIEALIQSVGATGTIIMPTQTVEFSDPSTWEYPPVDEMFWEYIRNNRLPFNSLTSPVSKGIGQIPETFRKYPNVVRTTHPLYSFAIYGGNQELVQQELDFGLGIKSPLGFLYTHKIPAKILLLGTDFESNTSLHLAEHFLQRRPFKQSSRMIDNNYEVDKSYFDIQLDIYDDFLELQREYQEEHSYFSEPIYTGNAEVYPFMDVVDFAIDYYRRKG